MDMTSNMSIATNMDMIDRGASVPSTYTIVCDERCNVVRSLAAVVKVWDRQGNFTFVDRDSHSQRAASLIKDLDQSRWSLFLIDESNDRYYGPDAIPMILKNLPFGKFACVFYILPGTMWLTRNLYAMISHVRGLVDKKVTA